MKKKKSEDNIESKLNPKSNVGKDSCPSICFERKPDSSSDYEEKRKSFGTVVDFLYNNIKSDESYFDVVFSFLSERSVPYLPNQHRDRFFFETSTKAKLRSLDFTEEEVNEHWKIFDEIINYKVGDYQKFRGFFLEEFMLRKYQEQCGAFEKVFCEQRIRPQHFTDFEEYTNNSDVDLIKIHSSSQVKGKSIFDNIIRFDINEFKANTMVFFESVYTDALTKKTIKSKKKVVHVSEVISIVDSIFPESKNNIFFVGFRSLTQEDKSNIDSMIKTIKFRTYHSAELMGALLKIREKFKSGNLFILGKVEILEMFYS